MDLELSSHAERRMATRGISRADIESALSRVIRTTPGQPGSVWVHGYASGGRVLKVCVSATDHRKVITAAWPD
ncbi:DUF4258 domain-containing protein [Streptomyces hokutonensis]|uniref:DUF4258 domain-containing protein n=1 Tax=Streptomyces hokutonensis TaxID=1306990 RepID=UPI00382D381A